MSMAWIIVLVLAGLIIAGLSFYLGRLLLLIKYAKQQQANKTDERNKTLAESIYTIAWAMHEGQCELSEGCLRVFVLLDHYVEPLGQNNATTYPGVFALYDKIKDMPTHEDRKKCQKSEIAAMDKARYNYEAQFKALIEADINTLIERFATESDNAHKK